MLDPQDVKDLIGHRVLVTSARHGRPHSGVLKGLRGQKLVIKPAGHGREELFDPCDVKRWAKGEATQPGRIPPSAQTLRDAHALELDRHRPIGWSTAAELAVMIKPNASANNVNSWRSQSKWLPERYWRKCGRHVFYNSRALRDDGVINAIRQRIGYDPIPKAEPEVLTIEVPPAEPAAAPEPPPVPAPAALSVVESVASPSPIPFAKPDSSATLLDRWTAAVRERAAAECLALEARAAEIRALADLEIDRQARGQM